MKIFKNFWNFFKKIFLFYKIFSFTSIKISKSHGPGERHEFSIKKYFFRKILMFFLWNFLYIFIFFLIPASLKLKIFFKKKSQKWWKFCEIFSKFWKFFCKFGEQFEKSLVLLKTLFFWIFCFFKNDHFVMSNFPQKCIFRP